MIDTLIAAYYPLFLMIAGTLLNSLTFLILCQPPFKATKQRPTIHYMRTIVIFDILMLYGWNLQHYLSAVYGFTLEEYSIPSCKFFVFLGYFTAQTTAWLRVFVCLDRYLALSRLQKTWFRHSKHVLIIIIGMIAVLALFNLHISIFGCFYASDGTININSRLYTIFPMWDYVDLAVYNLIPFILMMLLNSGTIYHMIRLRRTTTIQNSRIQHRSISIPLLTMTFLFLIMTVPASIAFAFFQNILSSTILHLADGMLFTYHITSFPLYMIAFTEFRQKFISIIKCTKTASKVAPIDTLQMNTLTAQAMVKLRATTQFMRHMHPQRNG